MSAREIQLLPEALSQQVARIQCCRRLSLILLRLYGIPEAFRSFRGFSRPGTWRQTLRQPREGFPAAAEVPYCDGYLRAVPLVSATVAALLSSICHPGHPAAVQGVPVYRKTRPPWCIW